MKERYGVACSVDHDKHSFFIKWYGFWLKIRQKFEINKEMKIIWCIEALEGST